MCAEMKVEKAEMFKQTATACIAKQGTKTNAAKTKKASKQYTSKL